jgi:hypothetical protein
MSDLGERSTELAPRSQSSRGYASGLFVVSALFRQNSQNADYRTSFTTLLALRSLYFVYNLKVVGTVQHRSLAQR